MTTQHLGDVDYEPLPSSLLGYPGCSRSVSTPFSVQGKILEGEGNRDSGDRVDDVDPSEMGVCEEVQGFMSCRNLEDLSFLFLPTCHMPSSFLCLLLTSDEIQHFKNNTHTQGGKCQGENHGRRTKVKRMAEGHDILQGEFVSFDL